ncbi:MAG: hypothetical protein Q9180_005417 [Flavoplaca navasiana]
MDHEKQSHVSETEILLVEERDVLALARLGKKPILKHSDASPSQPSVLRARYSLLGKRS